jgi:hypothetical protein
MGKYAHEVQTRAMHGMLAPAAIGMGRLMDAMESRHLDTFPKWPQEGQPQDARNTWRAHRVHSGLFVVKHTLDGDGTRQEGASFSREDGLKFVSIDDTVLYQGIPEMQIIEDREYMKYVKLQLSGRAAGQMATRIIEAYPITTSPIVVSEANPTIQEAA